MFPVSRRRFLLTSAAVAVAPLACTPVAVTTPSDPPVDPPKVDPGPIPAANSAFGCDLYAKLRTGMGNVFFSPFSIETALAMTAVGAKGNTLTEMEKVLHLPEAEKANAGFKAVLAALNGEGRKDRGFELSVANALWGMKGYPWREAYLKASQESFGAGLIEVDFKDEAAARTTINDWVEAATSKKIKDLIPQGLLSDLTTLVLTNAVYFKGQWAEKFDVKLTRDGSFTGTDGKKTDVPLMRKTGEMRYAETDDVQAVELAYKGGETSMTVLLPKKADGLAAVEKGLSAETLDKVWKGMADHNVVLTLPRFKVETKYTLNDPLQALGMKVAFTGKADFTGMHTSPETLYISAVLHKAFVEVNEEGTEAAAATAVVVTKKSEPPPPVKFSADRPFLFVIRHTPTNTVLFLGRCEKP